MHCTGLAPPSLAARGERLRRRGAALRRVDRSGAGIRGRGLRATIRPGLEVVERVDDPSTNLPVDRAGAVGAMLLERSAGETQESGRLGCAQKARRQTG